MIWIRVRDLLPGILGNYLVTIEDAFGTKLVNYAYYDPKDSKWVLWVDKHNYQDCTVIAWAPRAYPFNESD